MKTETELDNPYRTSFDTWVVKMLLSTADMNEGNVKERQVFKKLSKFFQRNPVTSEKLFASRRLEDMD